MFDLKPDSCGGDPARQLEEVMKKMMDPNLSEKQREAMAAKYQQIMADMMDMNKIKAQEEKAKQFGFNRVIVEPDGTGFKGSLYYVGGNGKTAKITGGSRKFLGE